MRHREKPQVTASSWDTSHETLHGSSPGPTPEGMRLVDAKEAWRVKAGPWAGATLAGGRQRGVVVVSRARTADGRWWYECDALLPARHQGPDGTTKAIGAPTPISVEADDIAQIPCDVCRPDRALLC
ncbi:hypothetical protein [Streptomyces sp. NPDC021212]|uniref:hypothetical protein n=1 Tax=Streptomyces sp. NPDC021212 TaxID=3365118 RepID=UPI003790D5AB